jgi:hypothetical protein
LVKEKEKLVTVFKALAQELISKKCSSRLQYAIARTIRFVSFGG